MGVPSIVSRWCVLCRLALHLRRCTVHIHYLHHVLAVLYCTHFVWLLYSLFFCGVHFYSFIIKKTWCLYVFIVVCNDVLKESPSLPYLHWPASADQWSCTSLGFLRLWEIRSPHYTPYCVYIMLQHILIHGVPLILMLLLYSGLSR